VKHDPSEDETPQYNTSVYLLFSPTYFSRKDSKSGLVGVFATLALAEQWALDATPPVADSNIVEWNVVGAFDIILDDDVEWALRSDEEEEN
jgi:hypothetical protein